MRSHLKNQAGSALPIVAAVLLLVSLLAGAAASTAQRTSQDAARDVNVKRALAAADAGIQLAAQRLASAGSLASNACLTGSAVGAECPTATTVNLGNGVSVSYWVSQQLGTGVTCRALPGYVAGTTERCVTAIGTASDVNRRVQARVTNANQPIPIWGTAGLIGRDSVHLWNSNEAWSPIGSNGQVTLTNSNKLHGSALLGPGAPAPVGQSQILGSPKFQYNPTPWDLPTAPVPDPVPPTSGNPYNNHNLSTTWYKAAAVGVPKRRFALTGSTYTMPAGTYNFCELFLGNSSTLKVSGTVKIYIDSPARPGSDCGTTGNRGRVIMENSVSADDVEVNDSNSPARLQIYVYGTRDEANNASYTCPSGNTYKSDVVMCNSVKLRSALYAPESQVILDNSVEMRGGIAAKSMYLGNSTKFWWTDSVKSIPGFDVKTGTKRQAWVECRKAPTTAGDPESGC
jgi:Tfp pilus assembly protein PilX